MARSKLRLLTIPVLPILVLAIVLLSVRGGAELRAGSSTNKTTDARITADWWSRAQQAIVESEYHLSRDELSHRKARRGEGESDAWQAPNRAHGLRTHFESKGVLVEPRVPVTEAWDVSMRWTAWGRQGAMQPVGPADSLLAEANRIEYRRGDHLEWYINSPIGLEQGFVLNTAPAPTAESPDSPLVIELRLDGNLRPVVSADGRSIDLLAAGGARILHYSELHAWDANGRELSSRMETRRADRRDSIRLVVDDSQATYPITIDPLMTFASWAAEGNQPAADFGFSVGTAGDVNADGYFDVIVGAPQFDFGQFDEGRAYVYLGSASGLSLTPIWTAEGNDDGHEFGFSVATAGDVNADGFADIIIGAPMFANGQSQEGQAVVYLGSPAGPELTPVWSTEGDQINAAHGFSVACAGDVNGDGFSDVLVGAREYANPEPQEGRALMFLGSAAGPTAVPAWSYESDQANTFLGNAVATAGDVNGDGFTDVLIGAFLFDGVEQDTGRVLIFHGSGSGLSATPDTQLDGVSEGELFGSSVSTAGDVNNDGYSDIVVGAQFYSNGQAMEGAAFVFHGGPSGVDATADWSIEGDQANAELGISVGTAGDVNGDGYADVIVGAHLWDNDQQDEGAVFVHLGSSTGLSTSADWTTEGNQTGAAFGISVGTAGDVNGDGYSDVIVGGNMYDLGQANEGRALVFLGRRSGLADSAGWSTQGEALDAGLGTSVAAAGDVNGDGYPDLIVGAPGFDGGQLGEGRALLYLGSQSGPTTPAAWSAEGEQTGAAYGSSVAGAGDVDNDGFAELIIGAPLHDGLEQDEGRASLYRGSAGGPSLIADWSVDGGQANAHYGASVASAGDVNGDGFADLIVGAPLFDGGQADEGRALLYLGSTSGLAVNPAWSAESDQAGARFGHAVATAGDVDGDEFGDVIVGANLLDGGENDEGAAFVYRGTHDGLSASAWWGVEADQAGAELGFAVGTAGDVNGDGFADVIVGAPLFDDDQQNEGRALLYTGSASGLSVMADWSADGDQDGARLGHALGTAGDVNGDGFADVIVGANLFDDAQTDAGRVAVYHGSALGLPAGPDWVATGTSDGEQLGFTVAGAGDLNGDAYADVVVGAPRFADGPAGEGAVYVYEGNNGPGVSLVPQQRRGDDLGQVARLGGSECADCFRIGALARSPFGRGPVNLEWEVKPLGVPFNGVGVLSATEVDSGLSGATISGLSVGLAEGGHFHWRARIRYSSAAFPFKRHSRWFTTPWNGSTETDIKTAGCRDEDGDGFGRFASPLCPAGAVADCDDTAFDCTTDCDDADGDGIPVCAGDCDNGNPNCMFDCTDDDSDGFCVDLDCDEANPQCTSDCTDDDSDGFCITSDCDDLNPNCDSDCTDDDSDGFCVTSDCDESNPNCDSDCADDDSDGFCVTNDCDESNPNCNADCTDLDSDNFCIDLDCDDTQANCTSSCIDDDDDGLSVCAGDCNDANPNCLQNCIDDDQDGFCIATDCDDTRPNCTSDCTDSDSDDFCITADCDDSKPNCTVDCNDLDDDGYCQDLDCDDSAAQTFPGAAPNDDPLACMDDSDDDDYGDDSPSGGVTAGTDCNDDTATASPAAQEICTDSIDNDCDLLVDLADDDCLALDVPTLQLVDHDTLIWDPALSADSYGLYRGRLTGAGFDYNHMCEATRLTAPMAVDRELPLPGEGFYYLVSGQTVDPGPAQLFIGGSLGFASSGTPRPESETILCGERVYVDPDLILSPGGGLSWATAYSGVGFAFAHQPFPDRGLEIWVRGTSSESFTATLDGNDRHGARLLGGFAGIESLPWDRSPVGNPTIIETAGPTVLQVDQAAIVVDGLTLRNGATGLRVISSGQPVELVDVNAEQLTQYGLDLVLNQPSTAELRVLSSSFGTASLGGIRAVATAGTLQGRIRGNSFTGGTGTAIRLEARALGADATVGIDVELNRIQAVNQALVLGAHVVNESVTATQSSFVASNLMLDTTGSMIVVQASGTFTTEPGAAAALAQPLIIGNTISGSGNQGIVSSATRGDISPDPSVHIVRSSPEIWDNLLTFGDGVAIEESSDDPLNNLFSDPIVVGNDLFGSGSLYRNEGAVLLPTIGDVNALPEASDNFDSDPLYVDRFASDYRLQLGTRTVVDFNSIAAYRFNNSDPGIGLDWIQAGFNAQGWLSGPFGMGYDTQGNADNLIRTTVDYPDVLTTASVYSRVRFTVDDASQVRSLLYGVEYDDGVVAWINGVEVYRSASMPPGPPQWDTAAALHESSNSEEPVYEIVDITLVGVPALVDGLNILAIGVWNASLPSTDMVLAPLLVLNPGDDNEALDRGHLDAPRLATKDFEGEGRQADGTGDGVSAPDVGGLER